MIKLNEKIILLFTIFITNLVLSQTNCENLKKENEALQSTNKVLTSENDYLKKILEINKPILETEKDNSLFKITKVIGNKAERRPVHIGMSNFDYVEIKDNVRAGELIITSDLSSFRNAKTINLLD